LRTVKISKNGKVSCSGKTVDKSECIKCDGLISINHFEKRIICGGKKYISGDKQ